MTDVIASRIQGTFTGYNGGMVFKLTNGHVWQQRRYKYKYKYAYRPVVRIYREGGGYLMAVEGMTDPIEVVKVTIVDEGPIVSDFRGYSRDARFEFQNGHVYVPAEYKYHYHYAYRPHAIVIDGINGLELRVDGMDEMIRVRRGR